MSARELWPFGGRPYVGAMCDLCERNDAPVVSFNDEGGTTLCEECCAALAVEHAEIE